MKKIRSWIMRNDLLTAVIVATLFGIVVLFMMGCTAKHRLIEGIRMYEEGKI